MITGDGAYIKKINRGLILQEIIRNNFTSRATLSKITGLNKATISTQVHELIQKGLIYETQQQHGAIGRRPILLSINESAGFVLGIDLDNPYCQFSVSNLKGEEVESKVIELESIDYYFVLHLLKKEILYFKQKYSNSTFGLIRVIVAIHGTVGSQQFIHFIPKLHWKDKDLIGDLAQHIDIGIDIENNANLSAYAEYVYQNQSNHIIHLTLSSGIGAGIIMNGKVYKGYNGYAGEIGHMTFIPGGKQCPCGNKGCWGMYASESVLLNELSNLLNIPVLTFEGIGHFIKEGNSTTYQYLERFIKYVAIGINNVVQLYNPQTIFLNSKLFRLYPDLFDKLKQNLVSSIGNYPNITISEFGNKSSIIGGQCLGISQFFEIGNLQMPPINRSKSGSLT